jgi:hypothetical protein
MMWVVVCPVSVARAVVRTLVVDNGSLTTDD